MTEARVEAVLLTGLYGSGKSSVAAEMADLLEGRGVRYAAIDLDWLAWANVGDGDGHGPIENPLLVPNLRAVVANDAAAGVRKFVLAGTIRSAEELDAMRSALAMPVRVVRLTVPVAVIESRLGGDPTSGRAGDLDVARRAAARAEGEGFEDLAVDNDRPIGEVAAEIVGWLGWA
jgi:chloramphenicol 3-O-phosphotransferase